MSVWPMHILRAQSYGELVLKTPQVVSERGWTGLGGGGLGGGGRGGGNGGGGLGDGGSGGGFGGDKQLG
jgi:hypothetical protein